MCGCSTVPVREADSSSPVYQAVQNADREAELADRGRRSVNMQSKTFRVLAHVTGTETGKTQLLVLSWFQPDETIDTSSCLLSMLTLKDQQKDLEGV